MHQANAIRLPGWAAILLVCCCFPAVVRAGSIRTLDGKTLTGAIATEPPGCLAITAPGNPPVRVELAKILSAQWTEGESRPLQQWVGRDIGQVPIGGSFRAQDGILTVRGSGTGLAGKTDQLHFVYQEFKGDGEIIARVRSLDGSERLGAAGLMFRAGLESSSPSAMVWVRGGGGMAFQARATANAAAPARRAESAGAPIWLKLCRSGKTFTAYCCADGRNWQPVATPQTVRMPEAALVGVAVCSHSNSGECVARFDRISIGAQAARDESSPGTRGILLRDGSLVAGEIRSADATAIRFHRQGDYVIPAGDVSRLLFAPIPRSAAEMMRPGRTGAILANGDFIDGEVAGIKDGKLMVRSILFGARQVELAKVVAAVLRDATPGVADYEIRTSDGSLVLAKAITLQRGAITADVPLLGELRIGAAELREVGVGPARRKSLLDLKASVPSGAGVSEQPAGGAVTTLAGVPCARGIALAGPRRLTYSLDGGFRTLIAQFGVPDGIAGSASLVLLLDGREAYRSPARTSADEPISILLGLASARELAIRIEAPAAQPAASACLADPVLVK